MKSIQLNQKWESLEVSMKRFAVSTPAGAMCPAGLDSVPSFAGPTQTENHGKAAKTDTTHIWHCTPLVAIRFLLYWACHALAWLLAGGFAAVRIPGMTCAPAEPN